MQFETVVRRSVPQEVSDQIASRVVSGELPPGGSLPSERELAEALGVSRPAVREAIKRLDAVGVVNVRQGGGTTVRDIRRDGGLDLLPILLMRGDRVDPAVVRSVVEARSQLGPVVAGLAAQRIDEPHLERLAQQVDALSAAVDAVTAQRIALAYWDIIVDGADSIVYRLLYNTLRAGYEPALDALAAVMADEVAAIENYRKLLHALRSGDTAAAESAAAVVLAPSTEALMAACRTMEGSHD